MIILRPDQAQLKSDIYAAWNAGAVDVCAVLPTGGGKSIVSSDITNDQNMLGAQQCIIAHRTELVSQMSMHVARRGIKHRIIGPKAVVAQVSADHRTEFGGRSFVNPDANCSVAGVDTLLAREAELKSWAAQIDLVTTDETHHLLMLNKWGKARAMFPRARGVGFTATPSRADDMGLGRHHDGVMDAMVIGPDMRALINIGALTDYEIAVPASDFNIDDEAITGGGDYSQKRMREASKKSHITGDVVTEYVKRAYGKRAICFATDVETSVEIAAKFNAVGIAAAAVSAKTPTAVRNEFVRRFRSGQILILVNVDLFGEGFDVPACEVVIMARPTASLGLYLQMFGRALRPMAGKLYGLIIDHVSNWKRHGLPDKAHFWTLDRRDKKSRSLLDPEDIPLTVCRSCSRPYERFHQRCPYCGAEPPLPDPVGRSLQQIDGDLMLLDRERLEAMRAATVLPSPAAVGSQAAYVAGPLAGAGAVNRQIEKHQAQQRLRDALAQWGAVERAKGRPDSESYRRFYICNNVDILTALTLPRADMEKLAATVEGWYS